MVESIFLCLKKKRFIDLELSTSFDNEYTSDGTHDETFSSNVVMVCPSIDKQLVIAFSCLNIEQIVCEHLREKRKSIVFLIFFRLNFIVLRHYFQIKFIYPIVSTIERRI